MPSPTARRCMRCTTTRWMWRPCSKTLEQVDLTAQRAELLQGLLSVPVIPGAALERSRHPGRTGQQLPGNPRFTWCAGFEQGVRLAPRCRIFHDVGLMEDRATLRIFGAAHLPTGCTTGWSMPIRFEATLQRMAGVVDQQNAGDPALSADGRRFFEASHAFPRCAGAGVSKGGSSPVAIPNRLLHGWRFALSSRRSGAEADGAAMRPPLQENRWYSGTFQKFSYFWRSEASYFVCLCPRKT
ncbi:hypothetical protein D0O09_31975 [Pseudomonas putida]|nr:hypothetical protein D0O09_31975 [Pseudomonas putida]